MTTRKNVTVNPAGPGFLGILTILFIGLKLGGVIAWSWWWVLAPLWAPAALGLLVFLVIVAVLFFADGKCK